MSRSPAAKGGNLVSLLLAAILLLAAASPVVAQEGGGWLQRWAAARELAAHERLLDRIRSLKSGPTAFASDGCSGGFSTVWRAIAAQWPEFAQQHGQYPPVEPCCVTHDRAYHAIAGAGSAKESYLARLQADQALRLCVAATGGQRSAALADLYGLSQPQVQLIYRQLAEAMFLAVRFGGGPCSGLSWRWGFGYPQC